MVTAYMPVSAETIPEQVVTQDLGELEQEVIKEPGSPINVNFSLLKSDKPRQTYIPQLIITSGNRTIMYNHVSSPYYGNPEYCRVRGTRTIMLIGLRIIDRLRNDGIEIRINDMPFDEGKREIQKYTETLGKELLNHLFKGKKKADS